MFGCLFGHKWKEIKSFDGRCDEYVLGYNRGKVNITAVLQKCKRCDTKKAFLKTHNGQFDRDFNLLEREIKEAGG